MPSCPKCGTIMSATDSACPSCGARINASSSKSYGSAQQQVSYVKELSNGKRPFGATALAGLGFIGAIGSFLLAGSYNIIPSISALSQISSTFGALSSIMPYFLAFTGIFSLISVYGFVRGNRWAWKIGALASILQVLSIISPNLLGLFVGIVSLYFLTSKPVKNWLRK
jgi:hypothetical protein